MSERPWRNGMTPKPERPAGTFGRVPRQGKDKRRKRTGYAVVLCHLSAALIAMGRGPPVVSVEPTAHSGICVSCLRAVCPHAPKPHAGPCFCLECAERDKRWDAVLTRNVGQ